MRHLMDGPIDQTLLPRQAAALLAGAALAVAAPAGHADPLPGPLGACVPGSCPDPFPPVNSGPFAGRDNGISVYVGKDFAVTGAAALVMQVIS